MRATGLVGGLILIVLGLCGPGCDNQSDSGGGATTQPAGRRPRVALMMKAGTNPFFAQMERGAREAAEKLGVDLQSYSLHKETNAEQQASQVETVISKGVDVMLVTPADSKAIVAPLVQAQARGIKIINIDNRIDGPTALAAGLKITCFIGPDNEEGSRLCSELMFKRIGNEGKVAMLEGVRGADNAEARKRGFQKALQAAGDKVILAEMDTGEWMTEPAQKKMEGILNRHADLKGVFCANDMMALGAIAAIDSAGRTGKITVVAYDNLKAAQEAIRAGKLTATVEQHPDRMGAMGVEAALKLTQGKTLPAEIPTQVDLVTIDNLDQFPK